MGPLSSLSRELKLPLSDVAVLKRGLRAIIRLVRVLPLVRDVTRFGLWIGRHDTAVDAGLIIKSCIRVTASAEYTMAAMPQIWTHLPCLVDAIAFANRRKSSAMPAQ